MKTKFCGKARRENVSDAVDCLCHVTSVLLATWFSRSNLVDVVMVCKHINVLTNVHRRIIFKTMNKNECAARKTVNPSSATSGRDPIYDIR